MFRLLCAIIQWKRTASQTPNDSLGSANIKLISVASTVYGMYFFLLPHCNYDSQAA
ncbi:hypothetical protein M378DRAFT_165785, partial [Amanita muscaria Koide BX008]